MYSEFVNHSHLGMFKPDHQHHRMRNATASSSRLT